MFLPGPRTTVSTFLDRIYRLLLVWSVRFCLAWDSRLHVPAGRSEAGWCECGSSHPSPSQPSRQRKKQEDWIMDHGIIAAGCSIFNTHAIRPTPIFPTHTLSLFLSLTHIVVVVLNTTYPRSFPPPPPS